MKFYSTNNRSLSMSFREAVLEGIAPDGGLFMPETIPVMPDSFFSALPEMNFSEVAFKVAKQFAGEDIPDADLKNITDDAFDFPVVLHRLTDNVQILELFHGPTLAFKDFGARFTSRVMSWFLRNSDRKYTVLVATSGDTGSAVANGFYNVPGIDVILLYPSGKVSSIQEKQLTTIGGNVTALEVEGTFDDCQRLVKEAFADKQIKEKRNLTSANSINFARLLPQSFYYFYAYAALASLNKDIIFCVPSGNLGNLTGGLIAGQMGLPVKKYIGAVNSNSVLSDYVKSGKYEPRPSVMTISNAMDVGNPSNMARIFDLYGHSHDEIKKVIFSSSTSEDDTRNAIREVYDKFGYILDPHGAVGYNAAKEFSINDESAISVILETAHPSKFPEVVAEVTGKSPDVPMRLQQILSREKQSVVIGKDYTQFREFLSPEF